VLEVKPGWFLRAEGRGPDIAFLKVSYTPDTGHVLLCDRVSVGDELWTFGHPVPGRHTDFSDGQPAALVYEGDSWSPDGQPHRRSGRVAGSVGGGCSGSAVLNPRTGGVCGMLYVSNKTSSAHMIPATEIREKLAEVVSGHTAAGDGEVAQVHALPAGNRLWLETLDDNQIREGRWPFPGRLLRSYLDAAAHAAETHPWVVPGTTPPPLTAVYVRQQAEATEMSAWPQSPFPAVIGGTEKLAAEVVFEGEDSCIVLAGPGAGKSSLLRSGMLNMVRSLLSTGRGREVPVRVLAADLAADLVDARRRVPEAIAASVETDLSAVEAMGTWPPEFFATEPLPGTRWLVLVDGLDEIVNRETRRKLVARLARLASSPGTLPYRFVIATRPLSGDELPRGPGWAARRFELLPFAADQFADFATTWFSALGLAEPRHTAHQFAGAVENEAMSDLARTPLMATMLCQIYALTPDRIVPRGRSAAYQAFVELLNDRQYALTAGGIHAQITKTLGGYGPEAISAASKLADGSIDLVTRLAVGRHQGESRPAEELLADWTNPQRPAHVPHDVWRSFLTGLLRRSSLLAQRDGHFAFIHQTVQEFLAARAMAADPPTSAGVALTQLFGERKPRPWLPKRWNPPSDEEYSYLGFLVDAWRHQPGPTKALRYMATRTGISGCVFLAFLYGIGTVLDPSVVAAAIASAAKIAASGRSSASERSHAASVLAILDDPRGIELLASFASGSIHSEPRKHYYFTFDRKLREAYRDIDRETARHLDALDRHSAASYLAEVGDARGADALAALAADQQIIGDGEIYRALAAGNLAQMGDPRGISLLLNVASDTAVSVEARVSAAGHLADLNEPKGAEVMVALAADPLVPAMARGNAARKLIELGDLRGLENLAAILVDEYVAADYVRQDAMEALVHAAACGSPEPLARVAGSPGAGPQTRREAAEALLDIGYPGAVGMLAAITADPALTSIDRDQSDLRRGYPDRNRDPEENGRHARDAADPSLSIRERFEAARQLARNGDPRAPELLRAIAADPAAGTAIRREANTELADYTVDTNRLAIAAARFLRHILGPSEE
jgi:hypothetical protein